MDEERVTKQQALAEIIKQHSAETGKCSTAIPSLTFMRQNERTGPAYGIHTLSLCIVAQGKKEVWLGQDRYPYGPGDYLVATVDLPISGQVIEASPNTPYLALKLEFTISQVLEW
ncbi:AraC family transcriptional regulator [Bacillus sp. JCM 19041]|uniref:AraC family transcriptional regulator n=1 Tax=Bacillus sp. JCM 19041 TaxID=1460637 RepID=UPI000AF91437